MPTQSNAVSKSDSKKRELPKHLCKHNRNDEWFRYNVPNGLKPKNIVLKCSKEHAIAYAKKWNKTRDTWSQDFVTELRNKIEGNTPDDFFVGPDSVTTYLIQWRDSLEATDSVRFNAIRDDAQNKKTNDWNSWLLAKRFATFCDKNGIKMKAVDSLTIARFWGTMSTDMQRKHITLKMFLNWACMNKKCNKLDPESFRSVRAGGMLHYAKKDTNKERHRMKEMDEFWTVYAKAGEMGVSFLQDAMLLGLLTTLREGDILTLRRDNGGYEKHILRKSILKSHNAKGEALGTNLFWDLKKHKTLAALLSQLNERARLMADCPFFVCHKFQAKRGSKEHRNQVMSSFLQHTWADVRDATGLWDHLEPRQRPGFNQIRSLASRLCEEQFGYSMNQISEGMAHTNPKMRKEGAPITYKYTSVGYPLKWTESELVIDGDAIGVNQYFQGVELNRVRTWENLTMAELQTLLWQKPIVQIAKEFDYSDSIICRVAKHNNLVQPKVGFWMMVQSGKVKHPMGEVLMEYAKR